MQTRKYVPAAKWHSEVEFNFSFIYTAVRAFSDNLEFDSFRIKNSKTAECRVREFAEYQQSNGIQKWNSASHLYMLAFRAFSYNLEFESFSNKKFKKLLNAVW